MKYETNPRRKNGAMRSIITAFAPLVSGSALPELRSRIHEQQPRGLSLFRLLLTCCKHIHDECNCQANLWEFISAQANRFLANAAEAFLQFGNMAGAAIAAFMTRRLWRSYHAMRTQESQGFPGLGLLPMQCIGDRV